MLAVGSSVAIHYAKGVPRSDLPGGGIPSCRDCIPDSDDPEDTSDCTTVKTELNFSFTFDKITWGY